MTNKNKIFISLFFIGSFISVPLIVSIKNKNSDDQKDVQRIYNLLQNMDLSKTTIELPKFIDPIMANYKTKKKIIKKIEELIPYNDSNIFIDIIYENDDIEITSNPQRISVIIKKHNVKTIINNKFYIKKI